jgi:uncharacterized protein (DUF2249 family)
MATGIRSAERLINVGDIDPQHRHIVTLQLFEHLATGDTLQLVMDHNPTPLRYQLEARHGSRCVWTYLEEGPDVWRVRLQNVFRSDVAHV